MKVLTGFGYFKNAQGLKLHKYELPIGDHPDPTNGLIQVEVEDQAALDVITLDAIPLTVAQQKQIIINQLSDIDYKSIRAIRTNDATRMGQYEAQAITLRAQLVALGNA